MGELWASAALALVLFCNKAQADDPALTLARVAVAEAGFNAPADHAAMWHVLQRRAQRAGWPIDRMARAYSSPLKRGMPAWARRAPGRAWAPVIARARAFLRGEVRDPCGAAKPDHWGSRALDYARAMRMGLVEVPCGQAVNAFFVVPR